MSRYKRSRLPAAAGGASSHTHRTCSRTMMEALVGRQTKREHVPPQQILSDFFAPRRSIDCVTYPRSCCAHGASAVVRAGRCCPRGGAWHFSLATPLLRCPGHSTRTTVTRSCLRWCCRRRRGGGGGRCSRLVAQRCTRQPEALPRRRRHSSSSSAAGLHSPC